MKNKFFFRVMCLALVAVLLVPMLVGGASASSLSKIDSFKRADVMEELSGATINGKPFNKAEYPANPLGEMQLLSLVEFGYSATGNLSDYGLFLYIYNPKKVSIEQTSGQNKVQLGLSPDQDGNCTSYYKFDLQFCSASKDGLFLKYFVKDYRDQIIRMNRRYVVSGFELKTFGNTNATEYEAGHFYSFTGYGAGFGKDANAAATLSCTYKGIDTINLTVRHTYFRTNGHESGNENKHNQLTSVWFTIPDKYVSDKQSLYSIHARWIEVKTAPILVTASYDFYQQALANRRHVLSGNEDSSIPYYVRGLRSSYGGAVYYDWTYNCGDSAPMADIYFYGRVTQLPFAFYSAQENLNNDGIFSLLHSLTPTSPAPGAVKGAVIHNYFTQYPRDGAIETVGGRVIPVELMESAVLKDTVVTLDDVVELKSYQGDKSAFEAFLRYGFDFKLYNDEYTVDPFEIIDPSLFELYAKQPSDALAEELSKKLLVSVDDVDDICADVQAASKSGGKVVLFRFAQTDYEAFNVSRYDSNAKVSYEDSYIAKMSVFLDFDVIDLTFVNDGSYLVIPVVSDPIDIVPDVQPPSDFGGGNDDWLQRLFAIILLIILIVLIIYFVPGVGKVIVAIIIFPFKLIGKLIDYIKESRR